MDLHLDISDNSSPGSLFIQFGKLLGPSIPALVGGVVGFFASVLQNVTQERRAQTRSVESTRLSLVAELSNVARIADNQFGFVVDGNTFFVRVPVFKSLFPSDELRKGVGLLSLEEAQAVLEFAYGYQEHLGYILGNARSSTGEAQFDSGANAIAYDYSSRQMRQYLLWSLYIIEESARFSAEILRQNLSRNGNKQIGDSGSATKVRRTSSFDNKTDYPDPKEGFPVRGRAPRRQRPR